MSTYYAPQFINKAGYSFIPTDDGRVIGYREGTAEVIAMGFRFLWSAAAASNENERWEGFYPKAMAIFNEGDSVTVVDSYGDEVTFPSKRMFDSYVKGSNLHY